jgi:hypothetical protein
MYIALLIILLVPAWFVLRAGFRRSSAALLSLGILSVAAVFLFFLFLGFWGEVLWFDSLGYSRRFWIEILARLGFAAAGAIIAVAVILLMAGRRTAGTWLAALLGLVLGLQWGLGDWQEILLYLHRVETPLREPVLGRTTSFYLFTLPLLDSLFFLALKIVTIGFLARLLSPLLVFTQEESMVTVRKRSPESGIWESAGSGGLYVNSAILAFVIAAGIYLLRFHLLYSIWGTVTGAGWTDVHIRLPAYTILCILFLAAGILLLILATGKFLPSALTSRMKNGLVPAAFIAIIGGFLVVSWAILLVVIPGLLQWLRVEPNEITFEEPYISENIRFTRHGFGLDRVEEREFPASGDFTPEIAADNRALLGNIRLWDRQALDAVYKQFQEIRLYYEFVGVDIDRYMVAGDYRQVMVSAREMQPANLPRQSKTFVNRRFKYTHGYGITMTPVSEFTGEGLPDLLIKDIPPKSRHPELAVDRPQIYYGELTDSHVIVNTSEGEFDYPRGEENVYIHYPGSGGVLLDSLWRKFLFGWKFDGTRLFLSGYPREDSRILFHREIRERVEEVAPFLEFDDDPYIVLDKGRLFWIIDAYTTSTYYPYSEEFSSREYIEARNGGDLVLSTRVNPHLQGVNYIRNSVKAVVDAFNGTVRFHVYDEEDPLIRAWQKIFPELFLKRGEMPGNLSAHVRYPTDMLLVQGLVYAKYHMTDPRVFYNQEDLWIRATEKYYNRVQPVRPYYVMWEMPGSDELEFVLILPFTPKNRQVMIGWVAGMCDGENYGRLLVYKFPKEKRVLGPQQVETKIDQDRFLSGQLSLWDQRGSKVIRGNVLAIPVEETILYVEPIFLQAETAAYPELRLVVLMHGDRLTYAPTFDEALRKLLQGAEAPPPAAAAAAAPAGPFFERLQEANDALAEYLARTGRGEFDRAAASLSRLQELLREMLNTVPAQETEPAPVDQRRVSPRE